MSSQEIMIFGVTDKVSGYKKANKEALILMNGLVKCDYNVKIEYIAQISEEFEVSETLTRYLKDKVAVIFISYTYQNSIAADVAKQLQGTKVIMFTAMQTAMQKQAVGAIKSNDGNNVIYIQKGEAPDDFETVLSEIVKAIG